VQDVRIPYQQKRMFGFVTFVFAETVKLILAKGNPHFVCDSRVLVKPYKEKGKVPDKYSLIPFILRIFAFISFFVSLNDSYVPNLTISGSIINSNRFRGKSIQLVRAHPGSILERHLISILVTKKAIMFIL
jgi:hypothetical protein